MSDRTVTGVVLVGCGIGLLLTAKSYADTHAEITGRMKEEWRRRYPEWPSWLAYLSIGASWRRGNAAFGYAAGVMAILGGALALTGFFG